MNQEIIICEGNGVQIGKTFHRRAKQLVSKNRAVWIDEKHTAIRLLSASTFEGEKKMDSTMAVNQSNDRYEPTEEDITRDDSREKDKLLRLAHKRVKDKKIIIRHTLAYVAACFICILLAKNYYYYNELFQGFMMGCLFISGILLTRRVATYLKLRLIGLNIFAVLNRTDHDKVMTEYKRLKRMEPEKIAKAYKTI